MKLAIAIGIIIFGSVLIGFSLRAKAAECYSYDAFLADVKAHGDHVVGYGKWTAVLSDSAIIIEDKKRVVLIAFKGGCFVTAIPLDDAAPEASPALTVPEPDARL